MLERGLLFVMLIIAAFVYTSCSNEDRLYLDNVRVALLESIYEFNTKSMTRISPGDRMIWSYTASNMSQCQLDASIDISLGVIGLVGAAVASPISGIVGVGMALWRYCTD